MSADESTAPLAVKRKFTVEGSSARKADGEILVGGIYKGLKPCDAAQKAVRQQFKVASSHPTDEIALAIRATRTKRIFYYLAKRLPVPAEKRLRTFKGQTFEVDYTYEARAISQEEFLGHGGAMKPSRA
jgi:hypothetical protein